MRARAQAALTELAPLLSMDEVMMIQRPFYFVTRFPRRTDYITLTG